MGLTHFLEALVFESDLTIDDSIVGRSLYTRHSLTNQCFMCLRRLKVWHFSPQDGCAGHLARSEEEPISMLRSHSVAA